MKPKYFLLLLILLAVALAGTNTYANNAYRYFNLYKNSETYKERHPEENREKEKPEHTGPTLDGWGNIVDEPPPPPDGYEWKQTEEYETSINNSGADNND